jgi:hypothetical protein
MHSHVKLLAQRFTVNKRRIQDANGGRSALNSASMALKWFTWESYPGYLFKTPRSSRMYSNLGECLLFRFLTVGWRVVLRISGLDSLTSVLLICIMSCAVSFLVRLLI